MHIRNLSCFSIFVNDLLAVVNHDQVTYADDSELHCCGENLQRVQDNLQSDLDQVQGCYKQIDCYYMHKFFRVNDNVDWILAEANYKESQCVNGLTLACV